LKFLFLERETKLFCHVFVLFRFVPAMLLLLLLLLFLVLFFFGFDEMMHAMDALIGLG